MKNVLYAAVEHIMMLSLLAPGQALIYASQPFQTVPLCAPELRRVRMRISHCRAHRTSVAHPLEKLRVGMAKEATSRFVRTTCGSGTADAIPTPWLPASAVSAALVIAGWLSFCTGTFSARLGAAPATAAWLPICTGTFSARLGAALATAAWLPSCTGMFSARLGAAVGRVGDNVAVAFAGLKAGEAGARVGGDKYVVAFAGLKAGAGGRGEGCCGPGCQRMLWFSAAECAVLNMLMLFCGRLCCHSWVARRTLPLHVHAVFDFYLFKKLTAACCHAMAKTICTKSQHGAHITVCLPFLLILISHIADFLIKGRNKHVKTERQCTSLGLAL